VEARPGPQGEAAISTVDTVEKLRRELLCGIKPDALDPLIAELVDVVVRLTAIAKTKGAKELAGMSMGDLAKAIVNLQKALDGTARLRSFAAGGPDSAPQAPQFILQVTPPAEAKPE
jgi:hypothetical protein